MVIPPFQVDWSEDTYLLINILNKTPTQQMFPLLDEIRLSEKSRPVFLVQTFLKVLLRDESTKDTALQYLRSVIQDEELKKIVKDRGVLFVGEQLFRMGEKELASEIWPYTFLLRKMLSLAHVTLLQIRLDVSRIEKANKDSKKVPPPKNESRTVRKYIEKHLDHHKKSLKKYISESLALLENVDPSLIRAFKKEIFKVVDRLNIQELQFLSLIIKKYGLFSTEVIRLFKESEDGLRFLKLQKTGSEIETGLGPLRGLMVNTISNESLVAWQRARDLTDENGACLIPVTQIVKVYPDRKIKSLRRVVTPYSGLSFGELIRIFYDKHDLPESELYEAVQLNGILKSPSMSLGYRVVLFFEELRLKRQNFVKVMDENNIIHGHPHPFNLFVSFVRKDYLQAQREKGNTINTIEYDPDNVSYDIEHYFEHEEEYEVVMRLGDWDQASST